MWIKLVDDTIGDIVQINHFSTYSFYDMHRGIRCCETVCQYCQKMSGDRAN